MTSPRHIKFRGRGLKSGLWVSGCYMGSEKIVSSIVFTDDDDKVQQVEIDEETLGQLTGMTDSHGAALYDGDILEVMVDGDKDSVFYHEVEFSSVCGGYVIDVEDYCDFYKTTVPWAGDMCYFEYKLVGNIHDTPGLMGSDKIN